nr:SURF1 family protein [Corynebacterium faecale]
MGNKPDGSRRKPRGGLKKFLTPGWFLSLAVIITFSYAAFTMLAPWQLNKDEDITQRNVQIREGYEREVVPYSEVFDADGHVLPENEWYRVSLTGQYLPDNEALLRLRPVETTPVFQSLTPFQLDDGPTVLINRGFVISEGTIVPEMSPAPSTPVTIVGLARRNEVLPDKQPLEDSGYQQVYGINTQQVGDVVGLDLGQDYVQLLEDQPGVLNAMPIPQLDRGSHLSYGMQWIAFGVMAPLGLGYFIWAELRERRRDKAERAEMSVQTAHADEEPSLAVAAAPSASLSSPAAPATSEHRRRSRYGDQHPDHYRDMAKRHEERF